MKHYVATHITPGGLTASGRVKLSEVTASSSANVNLILSPNFQKFEIEIFNLVPATDNTRLRMRVSFDGGSTYSSSAIYGSHHLESAIILVVNSNNTDDVTFDLGRFLGNASGEHCSGTVNIDSVGGNSRSFIFSGRLPRMDQSASISMTECAGTLATTGGSSTVRKVNAVRFSMNVGNISSGRFILYGIL